MANRKEELLSRLRNTLAIVSQATRFETAPGVSPPIDRSSTRSMVTSKEPGGNNEFGSSYQRLSEEQKLPSSSSSTVSPYPDSLYSSRSSSNEVGNRWSRLEESGSGGPSWHGQHANQMLGNQYSTGNYVPPGNSALDNLADVDDEDEFLYGSNSANERNETTTNYTAPDDVSCYYASGEPADGSQYSSSVYNAYPSPSSENRTHGDQSQQSSETKLSDFSSDLLKNMLKLVSNQNVSKPVARAANDSHGLMYGERFGQTAKDDGRQQMSDEDSLNFWNTLQTTPNAGNATSIDMREKISSSMKAAAEREKEKSQDLSVTVDKILDIIGCDGELSKLMQEKLKKGTEDKQDTDKEKVELERIRLEEVKEKAKEKQREEEEEAKKQQNELIKDQLLQFLLKGRPGSEKIHEDESMFDMFVSELEKKVESKSSKQNNKDVSECADDKLSPAKKEECPTEPAEKKSALQFAPRSTQLAKQKENVVTNMGLVVTRGSLLKTDADASVKVPPKDVSKPVSQIESSWTKSTDEFLRMLQSKDDVKGGDAKQARNVDEESHGFRRKSRENDRDLEDPRNIRTSERKSSGRSRSPLSKQEDSRYRKSNERYNATTESRDGRSRLYSRSPPHEASSRRESFERSTDVTEMHGVKQGRYSKSPGVKRNDPNDGSGEHASSALSSATPQKTEAAEVLDINQVQINTETSSSVDKSKEDMLADIKALQDELENLKRAKSGMVRTVPSEPTDFGNATLAADVTRQSSKEEKHVSEGTLKDSTSKVYHMGTVNVQIMQNEKPDGVDKSTNLKVSPTVESKTSSKGRLFAVEPSALRRRKLTDDRRDALEKSRNEMMVNIGALTTELVNLQRLSIGLSKKPANQLRDAMMMENQRMQSEMEDHLWVLKKATVELTEQLQQDWEKEAPKDADMTTRLSAPVTMSTITSELKAPVSASMTAAAPVSSSVLVTNLSSIGASSLQPQAPILTASDSKSEALSAVKEQSSKQVKPPTPKAKTDSKKTKHKSSSRDSSSSSNSSSSSSSASSSSRSNRSSSRNREQKRSRDRKTSKRSVDKYSSGRSRKYSRSRSRSPRNKNLPHYKNISISRRFGDRKRWTRASRSRSRDLKDDKEKSRNKYEHRTRSSSAKRPKKTTSRSRSRSTKKSRKSRSSSTKRSGKEADKKGSTKTTDSIAKESKSSEDKKVVEQSKVETIQTDVPGNSRESSKIGDTKSGIPLDKSAIEKAMEDRKRRALEMAINMYVNAEEYYDGGNLWCRKCDKVLSDIVALCQHLHSDQHQIVLDPNYNKSEQGAGPQIATNVGGASAPARGDEFLMPLQAFFCSLCCEFTKDRVHAEVHLKSISHNKKFKAFLSENGTYEFQYLINKMAAIVRSKQTPAEPAIEQKPPQQECLSETEVKRIKIMPLSHETKMSSDELQNEYKKIQMKVMSGSFERTISNQQQISPNKAAQSEEKRVITLDKKAGSVQKSGAQQIPSSSGLNLKDLAAFRGDAPSRAVAAESSKINDALRNIAGEKSIPTKPWLNISTAVKGREENKSIISRSSQELQSSKPIGGGIKLQIVKGKAPFKSPSSVQNTRATPWKRT